MASSADIPRDHVCQHIRTHQQSAWQFLSKELLSTRVGATQRRVWGSTTWPISGGAVSDQQVGTVTWWIGVSYVIDTSADAENLR